MEKGFGKDVKKVRKEKRKKLVEQSQGVQSEMEKSMAKIENLAIQSANDPDRVFDNLMPIVCDENILYQAAGKIGRNKGATTKGPPGDERTVDGFNKELVQEIVGELLRGEFRFRPIRRVYMIKSGKAPVTDEQRGEIIKIYKETGNITSEQLKLIKARPLGIPSFKDKLVQEAMRLVLNAIYEPVFARLNMNFGFRPAVGCADAINNTEVFAKSMEQVIEGDIKGAFENVEFNKLILILRKKVSDESFLKLILGGLKCGTIYLNFENATELGTAQGSTVSPLLYNVYFHEFEHYLNTDFRKFVEERNKAEARIDKPIPKLYKKASYEKTKLDYKTVVGNLKEAYKNRIKDPLRYETTYKKFVESRYIYKRLGDIQGSMPSRSKSRQTIRWWYTRYADDWIFLTNGSRQFAEEVKSKFADWIRDNLMLTVSVEKTNIVDLTKGEKVHFLGYQLGMQGQYKNILRGKDKKRIRRKAEKWRGSNKYVPVLGAKKLVFRQRVRNPSLTVAWDRKRVLSRLEENRFIRKVRGEYRGRSKTEWTTLEIPEIIQRYNYVMSGYLQYYVPVLTYVEDVQYLHFLLAYSCIHTLAQKLRTTVRKAFKKFTKNIVAKYVVKIDKKSEDGVTKSSETENRAAWLDWKKCQSIIKGILLDLSKKRAREGIFTSIAIINKTVDEISNVKVNWRTKFKLSMHCAICGSEDGIEYHHIRHVRIGQTAGFVQVMRQLNRKQLPCCKPCHAKIHSGQYDGMKLRDLYDETLVLL